MSAEGSSGVLVVGELDVWFRILRRMRKVRLWR